MSGFDSFENRRLPAYCHLPAAWLWQPSMFPNLKTFSLASCMENWMNRMQSVSPVGCFSFVVSALLAAFLFAFDGLS